MNAKDIRRFSASQVAETTGQTDWNRLRDAGDFEGQDDDDFAVDWSRAEIVTPKPKTMISVRIDNDLLEFFRAQGKGYQTRINAVLRAYKTAVDKNSA